MKHRLLLVDDDLELGELLRDYLGAEGFEIATVDDGATGATLAESGDYALVILDVMLPRLGGFDVLRRIRRASQVPVIMLTARGDDVDRIVGLELGADDYLPKPFNPRELLARIRSILRRSDPPAGNPPLPPGSLVSDDLLLDRGRRSVAVAGRGVVLTSVEFSLLEALVLHAGQVIGRDQLAEQVLGRPLSPYDRSIDVHVSSLRRKLGPASGGGERIVTVRGVGYQYVSGAGR